MDMDGMFIFASQLLPNNLKVSTTGKWKRGKIFMNLIIIIAWEKVGKGFNAWNGGGYGLYTF